MRSLAICLLGPVQVSLHGERLSELRSKKALALLAYLAVEPDRSHRREKLAGMLWPDYTESSARANLRRALADLRQAIGDDAATPPYLLATRQTIQFNPASDAWVDVTAFTNLVRPTVHPATVDQLEEAIALYRGPLLEQFSVPDSAGYEEWLLLTRERLQRLAVEALSRLSSEHEEQGAYERGLRHARRMVVLDPWREDAQRTVMRLLALNGRRVAALAHYFQEHRERLGFDLRVTVLGHVQRGGAPGAFDRLLASRLGAAAVDHLAQGEHGVLVGLVGDQITATPLDEVASKRKSLDAQLLALAPILAR